MVGTYYLSYLPFQFCWWWLRLWRRQPWYAVHIESEFDYFIFRNIQPYLLPLDVIVSKASLKAKLRDQIPPGTRIHSYPCCPDGVIMFRNAAWKYPVKSIIRIGLEHGAYNFKRFPKSKNYNMFNLYMMTSQADEQRLRERGVHSVKAIGYPKSDSLFNGSYGAEMLSGLRESLKLDPALPVVLFSSTWDGSGMSAVHKWYDQVSSLKDEYNILVTLHPWMSESYRRHLQNMPGIHYISAMDIYPYLLLADVCIGDTNSLIAEFCIVDKPIITFSVPKSERTMDDVIELIKSISIRVDEFGELRDAIPKALQTAAETSPLRKKVISTLIYPLDGKAGWRAAQQIIALIPALKPEA